MLDFKDLFGEALLKAETRINAREAFWIILQWDCCYNHQNFSLHQASHHRHRLVDIHKIQLPGASGSRL
jgi:hypothetical protein